MTGTDYLWNNGADRREKAEREETDRQTERRKKEREEGGIGSVCVWPMKGRKIKRGRQDVWTEKGGEKERKDDRHTEYRTSLR